MPQASITILKYQEIFGSSWKKEKEKKQRERTLKDSFRTLAENIKIVERILFSCLNTRTGKTARQSSASGTKEKHLDWILT